MGSLHNSLDDIPNFESIKSLDRGIEWKIVFGNKIKSKREKIFAMVRVSRIHLKPLLTLI